MVVSNPPYIPSADLAALAREVRDHDPRGGLDGGPDGLSAYRTIVGRADRLLRNGGILAFEVGHDQAEAVSEVCVQGGLKVLRRVADLSGKARVVLAQVMSDGRQAGSV
jgi:release factor glutamine methyltransferase